MNFSINSGGLGLHRADEVSFGGFLASIQDFCSSKEATGVQLSNAVRLYDVKNSFVAAILDLLIQWGGQNFNAGLDSLLKMKYTREDGTIQHQLESSRAGERKARLIATLKVLLKIQSILFGGRILQILNPALG